MLRPLFMLLLLLLCGSATAAAEVPIPPLTGRVVDQAGILTGSDRRELDELLHELEQEKGVQFVVLTVPTTAPETIEQYSIRVAEQWKIGRKKVDDGVIILVAVNDHAVRLEVGYGLEGAVPDAIAKRIIEEQILPRFRDTDYGSGLRDGIVALRRAIRNEPLPPPHRTGAAPPLGDLFRTGLFILLFGGPIVGAILKSLFGAFPGSVLSGLLTFGLFSLLAPAWLAAILGVIAFFLVFSTVLDSGFRSYGPRTYRGGGFGGGGFGGGGGGFSGGGGSFGGGGASGKW